MSIYTSPDRRSQDSSHPPRTQLPATAFALFLILPAAWCGPTAAAQQVPSNFDQIAASAQAAQQHGDTPRAIELYRQAVQVNPKWPDGWWYLGMLQYSSNDYAAAREALTHSIDLSPNIGPAISIRGLCEFETADYAQSLSDIQRGISLGAANQPRNASILHYHEGMLLAHAGRFEEALGAFSYFAQTGAPDPPIVLALGMAGLRSPLLPNQLGDGASQRDLYMAAGYAALSFLAGDMERADSDFQTLFQRFPAAANAHYLYGYLLFAKDPGKATAEFQRELAIAPSSPHTEAMLGWAFLMQEDYPQARLHGEKAATLMPSLTVAQLVLGRSLVETGDLKGGIDHLQKALALQPDNLEIHLALVSAYSNSGDREDAQRERKQCLALTGAPTANRETSVALP